jgi:hypothetical protein
MNTSNDWVVQNCRTGSLLPCDSIHGERGTRFIPEMDSDIYVTDMPIRHRRSLTIEARTESLDWRPVKGDRGRTYHSDFEGRLKDDFHSRRICRHDEW